jgi:hypothetical protein
MRKTILRRKEFSGEIVPAKDGIESLLLAYLAKSSAI